VVRGAASLRGRTFSILDLSLATGKAALDDLTTSSTIMFGYNNRVLGFLVHSVERTVNMNWEDILPPPQGVGTDHYLTAVTHVDGQMVEIIDVEKVLAEVAPVSEQVSFGVGSVEMHDRTSSNRVLIVDDSSVARK